MNRLGLMLHGNLPCHTRLDFGPVCRPWLFVVRQLAIGDAQRRGQDGGMIILFFWLFGPSRRTCLAERTPF